MSSIPATPPLRQPSPPSLLRRTVWLQLSQHRHGVGASRPPPVAVAAHGGRPGTQRRRRPPPGSDGNVNEDMDETLDELLDNYGKVVYRRGDTTPIAEVNDDAESLSCNRHCSGQVANDVKAGDIRVLFVKPLVYWTRFFIIATAFSRPQIDAIGSRIRDLAEQQFKRVPTGDSKPNSWTLLDFGKAFYNLEEFYGNATAIDVPFDQPPPFRQ
ncbi:unnamed protein product [Spirodela intermedia]|uniref:Protein Iojap, chloroplastic n=1 Tax=Spirodela intermedia TaxID=51605 RepID=A0A7I8JJP9_SPIIN|nr:unnamed protein product [Spirodela intermedia]CAA6670396.1 unnamed protein product [Spirodela intermedia]